MLGRLLVAELVSVIASDSAVIRDDEKGLSREHYGDAVGRVHPAYDASADAGRDRSYGILNRLGFNTQGWFPRRPSTLRHALRFRS